MLLIAFTFNVISPESVQNAAGPGNRAYLAGIIIAVFILSYLVYTLLKPEKF
jgi:K+-transporting ATPase KdpF subunit